METVSLLQYTHVGEFLETLAYPASPNQTSPSTVLASKAAEMEVTELQEKLFVEDSESCGQGQSPF